MHICIKWQKLVTEHLAVAIIVCFTLLEMQMGGFYSGKPSVTGNLKGFLSNTSFWLSKFSSKCSIKFCAWQTEFTWDTKRMKYMMKSWKISRDTVRDTLVTQGLWHIYPPLLSPSAWCQPPPLWAFWGREPRQRHETPPNSRKLVHRRTPP